MLLYAHSGSNAAKILSLNFEKKSHLSLKKLFSYSLTSRWGRLGLRPWRTSRRAPPN